MSEAPIFQIPESQNFCDYDSGFDPQIDYFQHLEEVTRNENRNQGLDSMHLNHKKSIISNRKHKHRHHPHSRSSAARKWLRSALQFWKRTKKKKKKNEWNNSPYSHSYSDSYLLYATEDYAPLKVISCRSGIGCYYNLRELNNISSDVKTGGNSASALPIYLVT